MAAKGFDKIGLRIPDVWSADWYRTHFRDVLSKGDARNVIGIGLTVTGETDEAATLTTSADVAALTTLPYVLTSASGTIPNERVLAGETGVVTVAIGSPGGNVTVGLADGGVPVGKLAVSPATSVLGRAAADSGYVFPIEATADGQVLRRVAGVLSFGTPVARATVTAVTSASGVVTLDYSLGDYFTLTLSENVTSWVISNPPGSGNGFSLMVELTQGGTPWTVAKPGTTPGGTLTVSTGSGAKDLLAITSFNNGTTLRSNIALAYS